MSLRDLFPPLRTALLPAVLLLLAAPVAQAQQAPPAARITGTVAKLDADTLTLAVADGKQMALRLPDGMRISAVTDTSPEAIKPGSFVGSAAVPGDNGTLTALEVHVFPPSMNGTGEGHRPWGQDWGAAPGASMTNGTVGDLVVANGRTITVKYGEGGVQTIVVPPDVPVVTIDRGDRSLLVPGAHVVAFYGKADDGALVAARLTVGKDGTVPPM